MNPQEKQLLKFEGKQRAALDLYIEKMDLAYKVLSERWPRPVLLVANDGWPTEKQQDDWEFEYSIWSELMSSEVEKAAQCAVIYVSKKLHYHYPSLCKMMRAKGYGPRTFALLDANGQIIS